MDVVFFDFEADFVDTLRCVPMIVRYKLDQVGVKLSLRAWSRFDVSTRARLATLPVSTDTEVQRYRVFLTQAIDAVGEPVVFLEPAVPDGLDAWQWPESVTEQAQRWQVALRGREAWSSLSILQRFALVKLTRSGHENQNFVPALKEFGLLG